MLDAARAMKAGAAFFCLLLKYLPAMWPKAVGAGLPRCNSSGANYSARSYGQGERRLMRGILKMALCIAVLGSSCCAPVRADVPFFPHADAPDYRAVYVSKSTYKGTRERRRIVTHHKGWVREEKIIEGQSWPQITYYGPHSLSFGLLDRSNAPELSIMRNAEGSGPYTRTGRLETFMGETCEVWSAPFHSVCITPDGITLWYRYGKEPARTVDAIVSLERQVVSQGEVTPPSQYLDRAWWVALLKEPEKPVPARSDVVVYMKLADYGQPGRGEATLRWHGQWRSIEEYDAEGRLKFSSSHESEGLSMSFGREPDGKLRWLQATKRAHAFPPDRRKGLDRNESLLGETCAWFDMMPGLMDAGLYHCITADDVVLKKVRSGRGFRQEWTAIRIVRAPIDRDSLLPPDDVFVPASWGIPTPSAAKP
jgi:hypothetical protein